MHRLLLLLSKIQKNGVKVVALAAIVVFVVLIVIFLIETNRLNEDIEKYESEITYLNEKHTEYLAALENHDELVNEIAQLEDETDKLENNNDSLKKEITTLAEEIDELERQNGEALKKLNGLSAPQ